MWYPFTVAVNKCDDVEEWMLRDSSCTLYVAGIAEPADLVFMSLEPATCRRENGNCTGNWKYRGIRYLFKPMIVLRGSVYYPFRIGFVSRDTTGIT